MAASEREALISYLRDFESLPSRCMGVFPFSSDDFFIRVHLLGYKLFPEEIYIYIYIYIYAINIINIVLV